MAAINGLINKDAYIEVLNQMKDVPELRKGAECINVHGHYVYNECPSCEIIDILYASVKDIKDIMLENKVIFRAVGMCNKYLYCVKWNIMESIDGARFIFRIRNDLILDCSIEFMDSIDTKTICDSLYIDGLYYDKHTNNTKIGLIPNDINYFALSGYVYRSDKIPKTSQKTLGAIYRWLDSILNITININKLEGTYKNKNIQELARYVAYTFICNNIKDADKRVNMITQLEANELTVRDFWEVRTASEGMYFAGIQGNTINLAKEL